MKNKNLLRTTQFLLLAGVSMVAFSVFAASLPNPTAAKIAACVKSQGAKCSSLAKDKIRYQACVEKVADLCTPANSNKK